jgi:shikimate dehydrogenase
MDQYAVIGNPIAQSKSPVIHTLFAQQTQQLMIYTSLLATADSFVQVTDQFRATGARGMNITAPFKLNAYAYVAQLTDRARAAGAINCIKFDGRASIGENFDGDGLVRDITDNLNTNLQGKSILLLGAGGAARGAIHPLLEQKPDRLTVCNRTATHAVAVTQLARANSAVDICEYRDLTKLGSFDVIIHATSASLHGQSLPLPASVFKADTLAYDLTYGKGLTPFLRQANQAGVTQLADGVGMLVEQAALAFTWWRGIKPSTREVIEQIRVPLI